MSAPGHDRHIEDVGAYLLGALSDSEATAFRRHLMRCEECTNELERLSVAVDALPRSVSPVAPPPSLRAALMETVRREAPASAAAPAPEPARRSRRGRALLPRLRAVTVWAAASLLVAVGGALGYGYGALDRGGERSTGKTLAAQVDRSRLPAGTARLVVPAERGAEPILRVEDLEQPPEGRVYQLWVMRGRQPTPAGLLAVQADGTGRAVVSDDLAGARELLVTRERQGGAPAPTETPLMRIPLS